MSEKELTRGGLNLNLRLFVKYVEKDKTPPAWLLRFIAEGVERYRKEREREEPYGPLWTVQAKHKGPGVEIILQAAALDAAGIGRPRAAELLGLEEKSEKTLQRYITKGRHQRDRGAAVQPWLYRHAIDLLLEEARLKAEERQALEAEIERADPHYPEDDIEPDYGH